jgi:hypothetical protein
MSTQLRIDFFRVVMPAEVTVRFEDLIRGVQNSADDETRNIDVRGAPIRMRKAEQRHDLWEADMTRIRMDALPVKAKISGEIERLIFDDDEGVGEETAFLYNPARQLLIVQRNWHGVSASNIARYFQDRGRLEAPISLQHILQEDAMERIGRMEVIRKLEVHMAPLGSPESLRKYGHGLSSMVDLLQEVQSPRATISLSMGRQPGSLSLANVVRMIKDVFKGTHEDVEKVQVTGRLDDEMQVIDLLDFRVQEVVDVDSDANRRLSYRTRIAALRQAWQNRRNEMQHLLTREE